METDLAWNAPRLDSPEALDLLRRKARKLFHSGAVTDAEPDDLAQELALRVLDKVAKFDATRGLPHVFLSMLVDHAATSLVRHNRAKKRQGGKHTSLHAAIGQGTEMTLIDVLSHDDLDLRRAAPLQQELEATDIRHDVAVAISSLSRRDRRLCRLAMRYSVTEMSRITGLPRTTIQSRLRRLQQQFQGLQDGG